MVGAHRRRSLLDLVDLDLLLVLGVRYVHVMAALVLVKLYWIGIFQSQARACHEIHHGGLAHRGLVFIMHRWNRVEFPRGVRPHRHGVLAEFRRGLLLDL